MLRTPARRAAQLSFLTQRRLRHAGYDEKKRWMRRNLGESISQIQAESLEPCAEPVTSASGFELLCSYSWKAAPKTPLGTTPGRHPSGPQIYVPGEAPAVVPRKLPVGLRPRRLRDKVRYYRDANTALMPSYPYEPMFQSMAALNPGFKFDDVDLIINRNALQLLFTFVDAVPKKDIRLYLATVNNTLIVTPAFERVSDTGRSKRNYGRHFEQLFTENRLQDSLTHHRAIRYELGPLNCAVLSELDAGLTCAGEAMASLDGRWTYHRGPREVPLSELSDAYQPDAMREKSLLEPQARQASGKPQIRHQPCSEVVRGGAGTLSKDAAELYASASPGLYLKMLQLWLGRVPFLVRGRFEGGFFKSVDVIHVATYFAAYETKWQVRLQKLVSLLRTLRELAGNTTDQRCIAIFDKALESRQLRVFSHHTVPPLPLPVDLRRHFWSHSGAAKETESRGSEEDRGRSRGSSAAAQVSY